MKSRLFLLSAACFLMFCQAGFANEESDVAEETSAVMMDEVVVTATRSAESIHRVPSNVTVITSDEIKKSGATNIPEILERQANIHMRSYSGNPSQSLIDMRGFGGNSPFGKTLVLLNGKKLNRPDMASVNWIQIPVQQIERIEVVRGANSVLYGDAAVGGVINIITKKGSRDLKTDVSVIGGSYGSHIERAGVSGSTGAFSFAATGENNSADGYRDHSRFHSRGAGLNLSWDVEDTLAVSLETVWNKTDYALPGPLTQQQLAEDRRQHGTNTLNDDVVSEHMDASLSIGKNIGTGQDVELRLAYGARDIVSNMASWWSPKFSSKDMKTFGFLPKYIFETDISGMKNKFIVGLDIYLETLDEDNYQSKDRRVKTSQGESKKESLGVYVRNELDISDHLILDVGARFERARIGGEETTIATHASLFDDEVTHRVNAIDIGLTRLFGKQVQLFGKFSTSYRYPFIDEQISHSMVAGNNVFNSDLEAETGKNYEIGGRFHGDRFDGNIAFFQIDMKDEIIADSTWAQKNLGETRHQGMEISFSYKLDDAIYFYGSYNYHKATFENGDYSGNEIPLVPNHQATLGLDLSLPYDFHLSPSARYVSASYMDGDEENSAEKLGGHSVYDLHLRYQPDGYLFGDMKLTGFLSLKNMFDKEYCAYGGYGSYYPSPGREWSFGATLEF